MANAGSRRTVHTVGATAKHHADRLAIVEISFARRPNSLYGTVFS